MEECGSGMCGGLWRTTVGGGGEFARNRSSKLDRHTADTPSSCPDPRGSCNFNETDSKGFFFPSPFLTFFFPATREPLLFEKTFFFFLSPP